jgi:hypothetical protein
MTDDSILKHYTAYTERMPRPRRTLKMIGLPCEVGTGLMAYTVE